MTDDQLKQLIESNAKSIAVLSDAMATEREAIAADREERRAERGQLYQYLGRIAAAQSNFYEVQADYSVFQSAEVQKLWVLGTHARGKRQKGRKIGVPH